MKIRRNQLNRRQAAYFLFLILPVASVPGQRPEAAPQIISLDTGSVIGHVKCGELEFPGHFAEIRLVPKPSDSNSSSVDQTATFNPPKQHLQIVLGHAGLDGSFRMDGVPVGDYLAIARLPGYVAPGTSANMFATDDQLKRLIVSVPTVHVDAGKVTSLDLALRRGAAISGRVQFADGSPMVGASVGWELAEANLARESVRMTKYSLLQQTMMTLEIYNSRRDEVVTDEEGRYRIFGLSPGNYILSTGISSQLPSAARVILSDGSSPGSDRLTNPYPEMTTVYGPGVFRRDLAKVVEIRGNEQETNANINVDLSGLHTVRGRVLAGEDRHVPSQAMVRLLDAGGNVSKFVMIEQDGAFQVDYLPPGSYILEVTAAPDRVSAAGTAAVSQIEHPYQLARVPVVTGSQNEVLPDILLTVLKPGEKMEYSH
jgi:hypothetical protein